jgi:hypothetical protein
MKPRIRLMALTALAGSELLVLARQPGLTTPTHFAGALSWLAGL